MTEVLYVSKPVGPPWNDSSKNLVRDLVETLSRYEPVILGRAGEAYAPPRGRVERVYAELRGHHYAPGLKENLRVLARLVTGRSVPLWHFFFAPNPRTASAARVARSIRRACTVQTVCSAPREGVDLRAALFADVTVVLSEATHARFVAEGIDPSRVRRIAPCVPAGGVRASAPRDVLRRGFEWPTDAPVVVYPGDLEFGGGAERMIDALADMPKETVLVLACRPKTEAARAKESELRTLVEARGLAPRVRWMGETPRILDVLAAADVVALPSVNLYAKMDYPLVLLEAMALGVPVVVASHTPAAELARAGACLAVQGDPGAVAEGVSGLLGDDAARRALGERGQAHVQTHHSPGRMAQAYESLYEALLP